MKLGIIGGSGLYEMDQIENPAWMEVPTPFGRPSDSFLQDVLSGNEVYFLPRHGRGHTLLPSEINHKANIYGFKTLGVEGIISVTAVGSLREELKPGDMCLPTQYYDRTKQSAEHTFFGNGLVAHISFGNPVCPLLHETLYTAASKTLTSMGNTNHVHREGTYVNMEGPAFSTKSESNTYREQGFDIIGMTSLPEAKLSREAEICYAPLALVTDYDCWHENADTVSAEMVAENIEKNLKQAKNVLKNIIERLSKARTCSCAHALNNAIMTKHDMIPSHVKENLAPIIGPYLR
ncbi:MAG: S-methyl-5'-thioadenosine phosphorylase [Kiritimatiellae bacterium]|nr:S-methyl-5'-thioadenosine phosphorylase [Kiritimatiellia bacterium]